MKYTLEHRQLLYVYVCICCMVEPGRLVVERQVFPTNSACAALSREYFG